MKLCSELDIQQGIKAQICPPVEIVITGRHPNSEVDFTLHATKPVCFNLLDPGLSTSRTMWVMPAL